MQSKQGKHLDRDRVSLDDDIEAHLCQLAMMENYANHDMYVKFTQEEASALEEKVLEYALTESIAEAKAARSVLHDPASIPPRL